MNEPFRIEKIDFETNFLKDRCLNDMLTKGKVNFNNFLMCSLCACNFAGVAVRIWKVLIGRDPTSLPFTTGKDRDVVMTAPLFALLATAFLAAMALDRPLSALLLLSRP